MARRSDPFIKIRWEAERLLQEMDIDALPIDPFEIARRLDIELRPLPSNAGGASGMLLHVGGQFGICYPTHVDSDGFKNFSVGHEIGHYRLPGHLDAVFDAGGRHISHAGFRSTDSYELEADHFAAALLMPTKLFAAAARRAGEGLKAVENLADQCNTSLESTAIRFAQTPWLSFAVRAGLSTTPLCPSHSRTFLISIGFVKARHFPLVVRPPSSMPTRRTSRGLYVPTVHQHCRIGLTGRTGRKLSRRSSVWGATARRSPCCPAWNPRMRSKMKTTTILKSRGRRDFAGNDPA